MLSEELAEYHEAIRRNPKDANAHNGLGYTILEFGDVTSSLAEIREAMRTKPKDSAYLDSLGWTQFAGGELKHSLASLREATRLANPPSDEIQGHLRCVERLSSLEGRTRRDPSRERRACRHRWETRCSRVVPGDAPVRRLGEVLS